MNLIFFGSDAFAIPSLEILARPPYKIVAVVTQPDRPAGRGKKITSCPCATAAQKLDLKLFQPETLKEEKIMAQLVALRPDILVVVAYGKFLPKKLIAACPKGAVNLHPSLLPKYRGAAPIQWALLNGDQKTGVTTMTILEEMDAGDIYLQEATTIVERENFIELEERLSHLGADLLLKTLAGIARGHLKRIPQNAKEVSFAPKLAKKDGQLHFAQPAQKLYQQVRALNPWPGTFCSWQTKILKVLRAEPSAINSNAKPGVVMDNTDSITVACGQGTLRLLEVQLEGKRKMPIKEFLKGHTLPTGTILK